jgi:predicted negative regulator of RcsB-dependent stress response
MAEFLSDAEKADAIKAWLKENGTSIIVGVSLAAVLVFSYRYWQDYTVTQSQSASNIYSSVQQDAAKSQSKIEQLKTDYAETPYASLAALHAAKNYALKGDNAAAIKELDWVVSHSSEALTQDLAKLRLARVYIASKQLDKASTLLEDSFPNAYASLVSELKGDIHLAKQEIQKAREAYDKALLSSKGLASDYLKMKRDDLGSAISVQKGS